MKREALGDAAWRIELPVGVDRAHVLELLGAWPRVVDVVVADRHVLVAFKPGAPPDDPEPLLARAALAAVNPPSRHVIRVTYDGPDLDDVARTAGLSRDEVIALHAREYDVQLVGFLPGFAYLGPLDPRLVLARRAAPRPRVPALSVGIAAGRTGVYPFVSPGGWHLIGTARDFVPFDAARGACLCLGDRVRFEPA